MKSKFIVEYTLRALITMDNGSPSLEYHRKQVLKSLIVPTVIQSASSNVCVEMLLPESKVEEL